MPFKVSAPGSLMLLGEYAVLHGKPALVCAVDKRITVTLTPRDDKLIEIQSDLHGAYSTSLTELTIERPFQFVLGALQHYRPRLLRGCDIHIHSAFSDKVGLGSSAAVTVATLAAIVTWLGLKITPHELVREGRQVVKHIQGVGSGADIAASVYGGMVAFQATPLLVEKFNVTHPLTVLYAGFKTPTVEAIKRVHQFYAGYPALFRHLQESVGRCAMEGIQLVKKKEWGKLGEIMTVQQGLMDSLGVNIPLLHDMVETLRQQPDILGAKISGSGLGDCVVGLGHQPSAHEFPGDSLLTRGVQHIPVEMTVQGVHCEKS